jgi:hypothetical protein
MAGTGSELRTDALSGFAVDFFSTVFVATVCAVPAVGRIEMLLLSALAVERFAASVSLHPFFISCSWRKSAPAASGEVEADECP